MRGASITSMIRHYVALRAQVTGGNLGQGDPEAVGVLDPHLDQVPGSATGSRAIGTAAAASRACSA